MKKLALILTAVLLTVALFAGAIVEDNTPIELGPMYNVPTGELLGRFPIAYETPANTNMEQKIQNRMQTISLPRIREVDHFDDSVLRDCYSQSKALATQAVLDAVRERGLNACVVHPSGIMGPEDFAVGETTSTMIKIINGEMPAGIDGSFNLCDVRDLADGTIRAAERGRSGECYILGNREVRFRDFARMIAEEAGTRPPRIFLSLGMANLMGKMMEKQAKRKGVKPLMTSFSVYNLARNNCFDSTKAMRELGYRTRSYRETMHDEIQWLIETGKVKTPAVKAAPMKPVPALACLIDSVEHCTGTAASRRVRRDKSGNLGFHTAV